MKKYHWEKNHAILFFDLLYKRNRCSYTFSYYHSYFLFTIILSFFFSKNNDSTIITLSIFYNVRTIEKKIWSDLHTDEESITESNRVGAKTTLEHISYAISKIWLINEIYFTSELFKTKIWISVYNACLSLERFTRNLTDYVQMASKETSELWSLTEMSKVI